LGFLIELERAHKVSSAGESHPHALSEPDGNLSAHPAPIIQPMEVFPISNGQTSSVLVGRFFQAKLQLDFSPAQIS